MGAHAAIEQSEAEARAVEVFRALANPVRFRIVTALARRGECIVGDLVLELPVAQSTVSEHLKVLRDAGVVRGTVDGPNRCYCLAPEALQVVRTVIDELATACCPPASPASLELALRSREGATS